MPERNSKPLWRRSMVPQSKSSNGPTRRKASSLSPDDGSSSAPLRGSIAAAGSPKIGKPQSPRPRRGSSLRPSGSSRASVGNDDVAACHFRGGSAERFCAELNLFAPSFEVNGKQYRKKMAAIGKLQFRAFEN